MTTGRLLKELGYNNRDFRVNTWTPRPYYGIQSWYMAVPDVLKKLDVKVIFPDNVIRFGLGLSSLCWNMRQNDDNW